MSAVFSVLPGAIILFLVLGSALLARLRGVDVFGALGRGAKKGILVLYNLLPTLICLFAVLTAFRASGALGFLEALLGPSAEALGIPRESLPVVLIRPFSGSSATAVGADVMKEYGPDSTVGRTVSVMLSVSETTFYAVAVYIGATSIKKTRYILPAALLVDVVAFTVAALSVRLFFR